jgi:1,4-dihydroxy-2-naphthoyl-CoA hydrolase
VPSTPGPLPESFTTGVHETLDITVVEASGERVVLTMPVNARVHQPTGILHGGVSALLAESAASFGAGLSVPNGHRVVGIELNASHLRPVSEGTVTATATPVRKGRAVQVWRIALVDGEQRATCEARCTLAVLPPA